MSWSMRWRSGVMESPLLKVGRGGRRSLARVRSKRKCYQGWNRQGEIPEERDVLGRGVVKGGRVARGGVAHPRLPRSGFVQGAAQFNKFYPQCSVGAVHVCASVRTADKTLCVMP